MVDKIKKYHLDSPSGVFTPLSRRDSTQPTASANPLSYHYAMLSSPIIIEMHEPSWPKWVKFGKVTKSGLNSNKQRNYEGKWI